MRRIAAHLIIVVIVAQLATGASALGQARVTSTPATAVDLPATPVGDQLAWLITLLSGGTEPPAEEEVASHFTPAALAEIPAPAIIGLAQQFAEAFGPFAFQGPARPVRPNQIVGYLTGRDGASFLVVLATEATPPHHLTGVALLPVPAPATLPPLAPESLGGQFDVGGRLLFLSCSGTGGPTVILEAGKGDSSGLLAPVQNGVAPLTRVCSYDRPNVSAGASDPAPVSRTAEDQVADLHALLTAADIPGPYVLAAHSYGGLISRLYAATYPGEVAGMVLVDTVHEDRAVRRQAMVSSEQWAALQDLESQFSDFERIDEEAGWEQVRQAQSATPLQPLPLVVLAAGIGSDPSAYPPDWPIADEEQLHQQLQVELAGLSPRGEYVLVEESGHYIQLEQPGLVIDAIVDVIKAVRDPSSWGIPVAATPTSGMALSSGFDAVLQAGMEEGLTGVALAIDRDGEVLFDRAVGLANGETQTPLSPTDRFRIYSITKAFTAVLVLQLVDDGVLALDDTVTDWLDDPAVSRIPNVDQITLRQLLTHTSGVYDYFAEDSPFWQDAYLGEEADWSRVWTPAELLAYADGANHAPDFAPGEGVRYSNTGYILLGLIVEEATDQAFADRLHERILDPLGLTDSFFAATEPVPGGTVQGYHLFGDELVNVSATHLSAQWTEGGMVSTTQDLMRFADALFGGELLQSASVAEMFTFVPSEPPGIAWGMGTAKMETAAGDLVGMSGAGPGFAARMFRLPEQDLTLVLLTNTNRGDSTVDVLFEQVIQAALGSATSAAAAIASTATPDS